MNFIESIDKYMSQSIHATCYLENSYFSLNIDNDILHVPFFCNSLVHRSLKKSYRNYLSVTMSSLRICKSLKIILSVYKYYIYKNIRRFTLTLGKHQSSFFLLYFQVSLISTDFHRSMFECVFFVDYG